MFCVTDFLTNVLDRTGATRNKVSRWQQFSGRWVLSKRAMRHGNITVSVWDIIALQMASVTPKRRIKRRSILLSVCGSKIYKLMSDLLAQNKPGTKTFDELVKLVQDHHAPKPLEIVQRFKFHNRFHRPGELRPRLWPNYVI